MNTESTEAWPVRKPGEAPPPITGQRPRSATHGAVALTGLVTLLMAILIVDFYQLGGNVQEMMFICAMPAFAMLGIGWWLNPPPSGLPLSTSDVTLQRCLVKLLGLGVTLALIALAYWLFPEYHGTYYDRVWEALRIIAIPFGLLALPYFYLVDRRSANPYDGYWHLGRAVLGNISSADWSKIVQHMLGWTVKGYFLPLMFIFSCDDLQHFARGTLPTLHGFRDWYDFLYNSFYALDVFVATMGYVFALKLFDTQIRSTEPTLLGWTSAIVCYPPFWSWIGKQYINYDTDVSWGDWLGGDPLLYPIWGSMILVLVVIYVWATFAFGCRFSNLTHRGIITNGPYRWTRHPAYVAKNISWWLVSVPFLARSPAHALRAVLCLVLLNGIYYLRARTEERHLSLDPVYREYSAWMDRHGLFRWIPRPLPNLLKPLDVGITLDKG